MNRSVLFLSHPSAFSVSPLHSLSDLFILFLSVKNPYKIHLYLSLSYIFSQILLWYVNKIESKGFQRYSISQFIIGWLLTLYLVFNVPVSKAILMSKQIMFVASPLSALIVTSSNKLIAFDKHGFPFINVLVVFDQSAPVQVFSYFVPNQ